MPEPTSHVFGDPNCEHRWSGPLDKHPTCLDCSFAYVAPAVPEPTTEAGKRTAESLRKLLPNMPLTWEGIDDRICAIEAEARHDVLTTLRERVVGLDPDDYADERTAANAFEAVLAEIDRLMAEAPE